MGPIGTRRICKSVISFERARGYTEEDLPNFRGTIICRPCYDPAGQEISDWKALADDNDRGMDETRDW